MTFHKDRWFENDNAEVVTNAVGGTQSKLDIDWTLLDIDWLYETAEVLERGAEKRGRNNWHRISVEDHLKHVLAHAIAAVRIYQEISDERVLSMPTDEYIAYKKEIQTHLTHLTCRAMFAHNRNG